MREVVVYLGCRAAAVQWAKEHGRGEEVVAITQGDWPLRGLGYYPRIIDEGAPFNPQDPITRQALDALKVLDAIYGKEG